MMLSSFLLALFWDTLDTGIIFILIFSLNSQIRFRFLFKKVHLFLVSCLICLQALQVGVFGASLG